jgi:putative permease
VNYHKQRKEKIKYLLFLSYCLLSLAFLVLIPRISLPLGVAYISALMSRPIYTKFLLANTRKKLFYLASGAFILALLIIPVVGIFQSFLDDIGQINEYLPKVDAFMKAKVITLKSVMVEKFNIRIESDPSIMIFTKLKSLSENILLWIPQAMGTLFEWLLLVPLFFVFFLKESSNMREAVFRLVPNLIFERVYILADQFNTKFIDYIFAKVLEATIVGIIITIGLSVINFPYAVLLGIVGGVTNILPYLGPVLGIAPAIMVAFIGELPMTQFGGMLVVFLIANLIDMVLVFPLMVSKIVNLNPVLVIVSVVVGSQVGGVLGMILSVPITAFLKLLINEVSKEIYT